MESVARRCVVCGWRLDPAAGGEHAVHEDPRGELGDLCVWCASVRETGRGVALRTPAVKPEDAVRPGRDALGGTVVRSLG